MDFYAGPEHQPSPSERSVSHGYTQEDGVTTAANILQNTSALETQTEPFCPPAQYFLRPTTLVSKQLPLTWIDADESGTYGPEGRREVLTAVKRTRSTPNLVDAENASPEAKKPRPNLYLSGRQRGDSMKIALKIPKRAQSVLQSIKGSSNDENNANYDSDSDASAECNFTDILGNNILPPGAKRIRKSISTGESPASQSANPSLLDRDMACLTVGQSTTRVSQGKPKGCKECKFLSIFCSLLEHNQRPCDSCIDSGLDCKVVESRRRKNPDVVGSKRVLSNPLPDAENAENSVTERITVDKERAADSMAATGSYLETPPSIKAGQSPETHSKTKVFSNSDPEHTELNTFFCHPISFSYDGNEPCHFCNYYNFGVFGYGEKIKVKVYDFHNGEGYTEISGGHYHQGMEPAKMCTECTLGRLQICLCPSHDMRWIEGLDMSNLSLDVSDDAMFSHDGPISTAPYPYCSVCPSAAIVQCFAQQEKGTDVNEEQPGCGLLLCKPCCSALEKQYKGDLSEMVHAASLGEDEDRYPLGLRADALFLTSFGELFKRLEEKS